MNAEQSAAFSAAAGHGPASMLLAIAWIVITLFILWVVWIAWGNYRAWTSGDVSVFDMLWSVLRATLLLMLLGFYLRP